MSSLSSAGGQLCDVDKLCVKDPVVTMCPNCDVAKQQVMLYVPTDSSSLDGITVTHTG